MKILRIGWLLSSLCLAFSTAPQQAYAFSTAPQDAESQFRLGESYLAGTGLPQDDQIAMKWLMQSAEQGYAPAQRLVGQMFAEGRGVERDPLEARFWYETAANNGDVTAQNLLGHYQPAETDVRSPNSTRTSSLTSAPSSPQPTVEPLELTLVPVATPAYSGPPHSSAPKKSALISHPVEAENRQQADLISKVEPSSHAASPTLQSHPPSIETAGSSPAENVYVVPSATTSSTTAISGEALPPITEVSYPTQRVALDAAFNETLDQAMLGDPFAQIKLAEHYASIADYVESYKWLVIAAQERKAWANIRRIGGDIRPLMSQQQIDEALARAQAIQSRIVINRRR